MTGLACPIEREMIRERTRADSREARAQGRVPAKAEITGERDRRTKPGANPALGTMETGCRFAEEPAPLRKGPRQTRPFRPGVTILPPGRLGSVSADQIGTS